MTESWPLMVEILELSVKLGDLSAMPKINDTAPWVSAQTTPGGTYIPKGWANRVAELGYLDNHSRSGWALDQGDYGETELANFWMKNRHRGVRELIHNDGRRGYLIMDGGYLSNWSSGWGHFDHVHVAMTDRDAFMWVQELRERYAREHAQEFMGVMVL